MNGELLQIEALKLKICRCCPKTSERPLELDIVPTSPHVRCLPHAGTSDIVHLVLPPKADQNRFRLTKALNFDVLITQARTGLLESYYPSTYAAIQAIRAMKITTSKPIPNETNEHLPNVFNGLSIDTTNGNLLVVLVLASSAAISTILTRSSLRKTSQIISSP